MDIARLVWTTVMFLLLAACSSGDDQSGKPASRVDHVWKEQVGTMDKARATEDTVMDAAAKQAEAVQEQTE
jgi:hypothetical protein